MGCMNNDNNIAREPSISCRQNISQGAHFKTGLTSTFWVPVKSRMASEVINAYPTITATPPRYLPKRNCVRETGLDNVSRMVPLRISLATAVLKMKRETKLPPKEAI